MHKPLNADRLTPNSSESKYSETGVLALVLENQSQSYSSKYTGYTETRITTSTWNRVDLNSITSAAILFAYI